MKKIILFCSLSAIALISTSQINKGNWLFGTSGNYTMRLDGNKSTSIFLNPTVGLFVMDKFAVGTGASVYLYTSDGLKSNGFGFGPFARYYFMSTDNDINFFVHPSFELTQSKNDYASEDNDDTSYKTQQWAIAAGPAFFFNEYIAMELTANYVFAKQEQADPSNYLRLQLGLQIHLGGKRG
ncbi:MAG: hypothetical protein ACKVOR_04900 [Flavobacteriales bacterium]